MSWVAGAMTSSSAATLSSAAGRWLSRCVGISGDGRRRPTPAWLDADTRAASSGLTMWGGACGGSTAPVGSSSDEVARNPAGCRGSRMPAILSEIPLAPYDPDMNDMILPPELERFAAEAIAAGRYRDKAELLAAGVSLLQRQERARVELLTSVLAATDT